jgi:hypothetical protein
VKLKVSMAKVSLFLCVATGAAICFAQNSEDQWRANVERQLEQVSAKLRGQGFSKTNTWVDSIPQGNQQYVEVTLRGHTSYGFVGVCDQDCGDIDFYLRDDQGNLIDSDTEPDDTPVVSVTPIYTGTFRLYIKMVRCSNAPCRWAIGQYQ